MKSHHTLSIQEIAQKFNTDIDQGLSGQEYERRYTQCGPNEIPEVAHVSLLGIFVSQFASPLIFILLAAAFLIFLFSDTPYDAFVISGVLLFNAILGTIQEWRTHAIVARLRQFLASECVVIRDGIHMVVRDKELVCGDIIILQPGQRVPADARIITQQGLQVDEAILTGESEPIYKTTEPLPSDTEIAQQTNMIFKGTYLLTGSGRAIVVATGKDTQIGALAILARNIDIKIQLREDINKLSYWILILLFGTCMCLGIMGIAAGRPLQELLVILSALFICVVPEGLPVVLTLVLVSGVYRMAKHNVLVKRMQAVETLGRAQIFLTDKTGTLTRNEMMVSMAYIADHLWSISGAGYESTGTITSSDITEHPSVFKDVARIIFLLQRTEVIYDEKNTTYLIKGDPTEAALYVFAQKMGFNEKNITEGYTLLYEIPFDQLKKYHAGVYHYENQLLIFVIGAPEVFTTSNIPIHEQQYNILLEKGLRVIATGFTSLDQSKENFLNQSDKDKEQTIHNALQGDITIIGLCGIEDAIREDVADSVARARNAGLSIIMATGDHKKTAIHVAMTVGIYQEGDGILTGRELDRMSDEQLTKMLDQVTVYARLSPVHKMRIINLFQQQNKIVAMTGDGVNDVPSLVAADLGIAMGRIGTEVAKEAADIVLLDDSFTHIVNAIEQGRHIFYILKQVILYFFSTNMGEVCLILLTLLVSLFVGKDFALPLTAAQILWLNLITDGFLDVGISMEPHEPGLLHPSWLARKRNLVDKFLILKSLLVALIMGAASIAIFAYYDHRIGIVHARTMTLITMAMFQWFNAWNCRSENRSIIQVGFFTNRWFLVAAIFVFCLQLLVVYAPFMNKIFQTTSLHATDWIIIITVSVSIIFVEEIRKMIVRANAGGF